MARSPDWTRSSERRAGSIVTMFQRLARRARDSRPALPSKARLCAAALLLTGLGLGGCAQQPQQLAAAAGHSKEYFPSSVYGRASRRVVEDGQPIPRGGGQYLVGKPYTIAGQTYYPSERRITQVGLASWYGDAFHGRLTANGEIYDRDSFTAAHPTMPLPSYARVTNLRNNTSMIVRVNDRGPYHSNRVMDVSRRVADALDIRRTGTARVKVEWVARASLAGSDDAKLAATLRLDGPARLDGVEERTMVAEAPARARVASLGAFAPAPFPARVRPAPYVEEERPEALEGYRSPRSAPSHHPRRDAEDSGRFRSEDDARGEPRGTAPRSTRDVEADDETPETGSLPRRGARPSLAEHRDAGRQTTHVARHDAKADTRAPRGAHAEPPMPPLRRSTVMAARVTPPARPARLASVTPPSRPHGARHRSHGD